MRYSPPLFRTCLRLFIGTYFCTLVHATSDPLNYRSIASYYVPPIPENVTTLLGLIQSRPDLSNLAAAMQQSGGFEQAFDTNPTWSFTFFAPNNDAFENAGRYFDTFQNTPKGKWWTGNTIIHHYVPNSILKTSNFNATYQRFQTATFLFVGSQVVDGKLTLNQVATVVESDIPVTNGVVHIIDKILDPSAQIYESDLPNVKQAFIPGSCSNTALPYC